MKILLVAVRDELKTGLEQALKAGSHNIIQYWHPIKAMDNLDEVVPEAVVFSGTDFPRHWKTFVTYLSYTFPDRKIPFFLLTPDVFDPEELRKAEYLSVACVPENDQSALENHLRQRLAPAKERPSGECAAYEPGPGERLEILFTSPDSLGLVFGRITRLSARGFSFKPTDPEKVSRLEPGTQLPKVSFFLNGTISSIMVEILDNKPDSVSCLFLNPPAELTESIAHLTA